MIVTKYRKDLLFNEEYQNYIKTILQEIEKRYFITPETIGFDEDHIHLLVQAAPKYSPSRIIQIIKSITAREMFKKFEVIKKELWGGEFWSDGGYVATVGEGTNADIVRNYIKKQGRKDDQLRLLDFSEA
jgi:putative transposase